MFAINSHNSGKQAQKNESGISTETGPAQCILGTENLTKSKEFLEERVHSKMKISSIMTFTFLIMPIVSTFFWPLFLAGRRRYGKVI